MAALPPFRQIQASQIPGAPLWFIPFLQAFNRGFQPVYDAINGALTLGANLPAQVKQITYTPPTDGYPAYSAAVLTFACTLKTKPALVILAQVQRKGTPTVGTTESAVSLNQWSVQAGSISVDSLAGLVPGVEYTLTFLVM